MAKKIGLEAVVNYMPENVVKASDLDYLVPLIPPMVKDKLKFPDEVRRLKDNDAAEILAEGVSKKLLDQAELGPDDIDLIIANNCGGKYTVPMVGGYIHWKLGFTQDTPVFNLSNACASFVDACWMAWNFILAGTYKRILVATVSAWDTKGGQVRYDASDPFSYLMGDGAGAAIVSDENLICEFLAYHNRTFSEVYDLCGADIRCPLNPQLEEAAGQPEMTSYLYGTPEFMEWWQVHGKTFGIDGLRGAMEKAGLALADIDMIFMHQPADMLYTPWMDGAEEAGVAKEKWIHTWDKYGNLSNAVVPVNLAEYHEAGKLSKGDIQVWITIGAGGHAPTMVARWLG